jgi:hypothetical protein
MNKCYVEMNLKPEEFDFLLYQKVIKNSKLLYNLLIGVEENFITFFISLNFQT